MLIHRYMTADKGARIVAHVFWADPHQDLTDETRGTASFITRDRPTDTWNAAIVLVDGVSYGVWKARVEVDHFTFGDDCEVK